VEYGLHKAHALGTATLLDPAPAVKLPDSLYPSIDYIKPNETEATTLTGIPVRDAASAAEAGRWLVSRGAGSAIVTLGENGSVLVRGDRVTHFPAVRVEAVDSTGAGDVFSGALMAALAKGDSIDAAVMFASRAAALSVTRFGVVEAIPELAEVTASASEAHQR
jgi:ribokinase